MSVIVTSVSGSVNWSILHVIVCIVKCLPNHEKWVHPVANFILLLTANVFVITKNDQA